MWLLLAVAVAVGWNSIRELIIDSKNAKRNVFSKYEICIILYEGKAMQVLWCLHRLCLFMSSVIYNVSSEAFHQTKTNPVC